MEALTDLVSSETETLSSRQSSNSPAADWPGADGYSERVRIVVKLLAMYPRVTDPKLTIAAYEEELRDLPGHWIRRACKAITQDPQVKWLPTVAEIKARAARLFRDDRERAAGQIEYSATGGRPALSVGRELHLMCEGPALRLAEGKR